MKAHLCPNCGADDWEVKAGYKICTYCNTKIPLSEIDEQTIVKREQEIESNKIFGKWESDPDEDDDGIKGTMFIWEDLTGIVRLEIPPNTKTVKEMDADFLNLKGYLKTLSLGVSLIKKGTKTYSVKLRGSCSGESYAKSLFSSSLKTYSDQFSFESLSDEALPEFGILVQLSNDKIKLIGADDGDETIFEKVE